MAEQSSHWPNSLNNRDLFTVAWFDSLRLPFFASNNDLGILPMPFIKPLSSML